MYNENMIYIDMQKKPTTSKKETILQVCNISKNILFSTNICNVNKFLSDNHKEKIYIIDNKTNN